MRLSNDFLLNLNIRYFYGRLVIIIDVHERFNEILQTRETLDKAIDAHEGKYDVVKQTYLNQLLLAFNTKKKFEVFQHLPDVDTEIIDLSYSSENLGQIHLVDDPREKIEEKKRCDYGYAQGLDWQAVVFFDSPNSVHYLLILNDEGEFNICKTTNLVQGNHSIKEDEFIRGIIHPEHYGPYWTSTQEQFNIAGLSMQVEDREDIYHGFTKGFVKLTSVLEYAADVLERENTETRHQIESYKSNKKALEKLVQS